MVTPINEIYVKVALKHNISEELIRSVGMTVFENLRECLDRRDELSYELLKIGDFHLKMGKFERTHLNGNSALSEEQLQTNKDVYEKILKFREEKRIKREMRYGSKDNNKEHREILPGMDSLDTIQDKQNETPTEGESLPTLPE